METIVTKTQSNVPVLLEIREDHKGFFQIHGLFTHPKTKEAKDIVLFNWGKVQNVEGAQGYGTLLPIPKADWERAVALREAAKAKAAIENLQLIPISIQGNLLHFDGFILSARISKEAWQKVKQLFRYLDSAINEDKWGGDDFAGWVVIPGKESEVEDLLGIDSEKRVAYRQAKAEETAQAKQEARQELRRIENLFFDTGEKPDSCLPQGEIIPVGQGQTILGGGTWFVVNSQDIWLIRNNGRDGDDWSLNNVRTGGAGAIGWRLPYNQELAAKITKFAPLGG